MLVAAVGLVSLAGLVTPTASALSPTTRLHTASLPGPASVTVRWHQVQSGLSQPTQVTSARDGRKRMFVVEKSGVVRVWNKGTLHARPYLDIRGKVRDDGERGLLSIAFSPNFRQKPRMWAAYNRNDGDLVIARFSASRPGATHVRKSSKKVLLRVEHSTYSNHNGGQLAFGPNNLLYIGVGDGGSSGDPFNAAQSKHSLLGKILRIDALHSCNGKGYCVVNSNPYAGSTPGRSEIWLRGLRNPWRFSFDPMSRLLWIGDVGQDAYEEVDKVRPRDGGRDLGWSCWEANTKYNSSRCLPGVNYLFPSVVVAHPKAESIIGGFVYRGHRYRDIMSGLYVFGDYTTGKVWTFRSGQGRFLQKQRLPQLDSFGTGNHGELWAVTLDGGLWRMRAT
jgi:glucose/arabinose dehydrogenase